jgi:hypothetical protein
VAQSSLSVVVLRRRHGNAHRERLAELGFSAVAELVEREGRLAGVERVQCGDAALGVGPHRHAGCALLPRRVLFAVLRRKCVKLCACLKVFSAGPEHRHNESQRHKRQAHQTCSRPHR